MADTLLPTFNITREQIAAFVKDPRTVRDIEAFLRMVREEVPGVLVAKVDENRRIDTDSTLTGGSDLSADLTLGIDLTAEAERIRDVAGTALLDSTTIDFTVNDAGDTITADVKSGSIGATQLADTAVTPGSYTSANITVDQDGRVTAAANGSGAAAWVAVTSWTWSTNVTTVTLTGLGGYSELLILITGITTSSTGFRFLQASTDNGVSVYSASGDYKSFAVTGIAANQGDMCGHTTTQTAAVSMMCRIEGNIANNTKIYTSVNQGHGYCANSGMVTSVINAVKLGVTAGNITAGSITILGR